MSTPPFRLFVAIELPPAVRDVLADLQKRLQTLDQERVIRWTAISSIHLTLKFLGETSTDKQASMEAALREAAKAQNEHTFTLSVGGVGCFPNLRAPRVVWTGCGGDVEQLHRLRDAVERT